MKTIDEIDVFMVQDDLTSPVAISKPGDLRFTKYGITEYEVQYWSGSDWVTILVRGTRANTWSLRAPSAPDLPPSDWPSRSTARRILVGDGPTPSLRVGLLPHSLEVPRNLPSDVASQRE
jgi:hypothetical protein